MASSTINLKHSTAGRESLWSRPRGVATLIASTHPFVYQKKKTINLKLLVDAKSNKVVYAEAKKDFVDFLFGLLELPIGTVLSLLVNRGKSGPGSLAKIHASVKTLDDDYLQSDRTRNSLLSPTIVDDPNKSNKANPTPLLKQLAYPQQNSLYSSYSYSSSSRKDVVEGHVKGVVTYMVMDDLTVKPMSTISSISILNNMRVKDFGSLDEKNVVVDMNKGLELLKASFESTTVLSDVFLPAVQFPSTSGKRGRLAKPDSLKSFDFS